MINTLFRISVFGDFLSVEATPENSVVFMNALNALGAQFLPNIIPENFPPEQMRLPMPRLSYIDAQEKVVVKLLSNRIDVEATFGELEQSVEQYLTRLAPLHQHIAAVWQQFPAGTMGNRLALYSENLLPVEDAKVLVSYCHRNAANLTLCDGELKDWNIRMNIQKDISFGASQTTELSNMVTSLTLGELIRQGSTNRLQPMQGLIINLDMNTVMENATNRFTPAELRNFSEAVLPTYMELITRIEEDVLCPHD